MSPPLRAAHADWDKIIDASISPITTIIFPSGSCMVRQGIRSPLQARQGRFDSLTTLQRRLHACTVASMQPLARNRVFGGLSIAADPVASGSVVTDPVNGNRGKTMKISHCIAGSSYWTSWYETFENLSTSSKMRSSETDEIVVLYLIYIRCFSMNKIIQSDQALVCNFWNRQTRRNQDHSLKPL